TDLKDLIKSVKQGLYVTELIGFGVNGVTGDYSRGAVGLWIDNGELAYPVEEITIAGNLLDMFRAIEGVGSDLVFRDRTSAPTVRAAKRPVAGPEERRAMLGRTARPTLFAHGQHAERHVEVK